MKKLIIPVLLFIILSSGQVNGEIDKNKCTEIRECSEFMWYKIVSLCINDLGARVSSEECKEFIKNKCKNYSNLESSFEDALKLS